MEKGNYIPGEEGRSKKYSRSIPSEQRVRGWPERNCGNGIVPFCSLPSTNLTGVACVHIGIDEWVGRKGGDVNRSRI